MSSNHHIDVRSNRKLSGFTLIELLVVISIIALLISILLPSLHQARQAACDTRCKVNMRQVFQGIYQYADDNKGLHPTSYRTYGGGAIMDILMASMGLAPYSQTIQQAYTNGTYSGFTPEVYYNRPGGGQAQYLYEMGYKGFKGTIKYHPEMIQKTIFWCPAELLPSQDIDFEYAMGSYATCGKLFPNQFLSSPSNVPYYGINIFSPTGVYKPSQSVAQCCSGGGQYLGWNRDLYYATNRGHSAGDYGWAGGGGLFNRNDGAFMKHFMATNGSFFDGHVGSLRANSEQPTAWGGRDLKDFKLLDMTLILNPATQDPFDRLMQFDTIN